MNTEEELAYIRGRQSAWVTLLRQACIELGPESKEANADRWRIERAETVRILRQRQARSALRGKLMHPDDVEATS